ncbi:hypothetical protein [Methylocystis echinoides]|uniref:hypothetical protein n=1 Tax=Methylocystis echinoides TaxID=29468 RepID=UPI0024904618|nr:hypothetical protein [Methylocystis echinoides]
MEKKITLLVFGDGSHDLRCAAKRVEREACASKVFFQVKTYNFERIAGNFPSFWTQWGGFLLENERGAGYWLWKPFLILETLSRIKENDFLLYCDSGCELLSEKSADLSLLFPDHHEFEVTLFRIDGHPNDSWTNHYCLSRLNVSARIARRPQYAATAIALKNCARVREFIKEWYDMASLDNGALLIDRSEVESSFFKEHRHDQSIMSIVALQRLGAGTLHINELPYTTLESGEFFIHALRNKTGHPKSKHHHISTRIKRRLAREAQRWLHLEQKYRAGLQ